MKEFKIVNGVRFEIMKPLEGESRRIRTRHDLSSCYDRPSETKKEYLNIGKVLF